jgi:hypothetical protein
VTILLHEKCRQRVRTDEPTTGGSMSINTFCQRNEFSRSFYYKLRRDGIGPAEIHVGSIVRISHEAERAWLKKRARTPVKGGA